MNLTQNARSPIKRLGPGSVYMVSIALLAVSCVAKGRYDEAVSELRFFQSAYEDQKSFAGALEADAEELRGELEMLASGGAQPIEAGATDVIDERMQRLERMVGNLGGAPGDVTVLNVEGGYGLRMTDSILFGSGSVELHEDGRKLLEELVRKIESRPFRRILVRGHTDSDPIVRPETQRRFPHGNLQLSVERAMTVATILAASEGVPASRVAVAGFGSSDPVAPNDSALNKQRNRRVEIFVLESEKEASVDG